MQVYLSCLFLFWFLLKNSQSKASLFYTGSYLGNIFIVIFLFSQLNFHFNFLLELTLGIYQILLSLISVQKKNIFINVTKSSLSMFFIFFNFESHKYYHSQKLCHNIFYRCQSKHVPLTKNMLKVYYIKIIFYLNFQRYFFLFFQNRIKNRDIQKKSVKIFSIKRKK